LFQINRLLPASCKQFDGVANLAQPALVGKRPLLNRLVLAEALTVFEADNVADNPQKISRRHGFVAR
jgi:hypothetical protein